MISYLDFEKPIAELEGRIESLRRLAEDEDAGVDVHDEVGVLKTKLEQLIQDTYAKLTPWQKTQVARHPDRPQFLDYVEHLLSNFTPLAGDRKFGDDEALIGGLGVFRDRRVMVIGHQKGRNTESRVKRNFGMARPEGYRKAVRLMELAGRFHLPVLTFVDTPGAYPGIGAEERGQAEAIARCTAACLRLPTALVSVVIGEGGSGGAVALATANKVIMLEHSVYSVISPEGCASILWRDAAKASDAASALKITSEDLRKLGVIDSIIQEPVGGAHRSHDEAIRSVGDELEASLLALEGSGDIAKDRADKFAKMGEALLV
ncbi:MAG: acetyl-CoA carboxylase carboxyltransferase subunit alpha [SAR116 cluster bacterium]|nr:MAG: acetyl-CoA carboxylase carboxyltransferase subunit alpha [SAR116 cluster bacterium]|tara:strand:+ start:3509 stop:4465 length:957 start_codon:yes stop_codon:yes gene_type:complete